jgi:hypothetical protein
MVDVAMVTLITGESFLWFYADWLTGSSPGLRLSGCLQSDHDGTPEDDEAGDSNNGQPETIL